MYVCVCVCMCVRMLLCMYLGTALTSDYFSRSLLGNLANPGEVWLKSDRKRKYSNHLRISVSIFEDVTQFPNGTRLLRYTHESKQPRWFIKDVNLRTIEFWIEPTLYSEEDFWSNYKFQQWVKGDVVLICSFNDCQKSNLKVVKIIQHQMLLYP